MTSLSQGSNQAYRRGCLQGLLHRLQTQNGKKLFPHQSTPSQKNRKLLPRIKKLQHSGHSKSNNHGLHNKTSTTGEIIPEARAFPDQISTIAKTPISQGPMLPGTVNFVSTARF
jgi:hypothetical protein